jgi:hypothetical protein
MIDHHAHVHRANDHLVHNHTSVHHLPHHRLIPSESMVPNNGETC